MKKELKAAVFDLDGTLLDTLEEIVQAANAGLAARGFPGHEKEKYRGFIGDGPRKLIFRALPDNARTPENIDACLALYLDAYRQAGDRHTHVFPGIPDLLNALEKENIMMAVLTNKQDDLARNCVSRFLSTWHFEVVFGLKDGVPPKPDPAGAIAVAGRLGISPEEIAYVGDSDTDMATALAAGMFPVGVGWGFRPVMELRNSGAKMILNRPVELISLFASEKGKLP